MIVEGMGKFIYENGIKTMKRLKRVEGLHLSPGSILGSLPKGNWPQFGMIHAKDWKHPYVS